MCRCVASPTLSPTVQRFKDLTVRSEAELDKAVLDMETRISQETMTLNEEKALMAAVRKLRYVPL